MPSAGCTSIAARSIRRLATPGTTSSWALVRRSPNLLWARPGRPDLPDRRGLRANPERWDRKGLKERADRWDPEDFKGNRERSDPKGLKGLRGLRGLRGLKANQDR